MKNLGAGSKFLLRGECDGQAHIGVTVSKKGVDSLWQEHIHQHRIDHRQHDQDDPELIPNSLKRRRRSLKQNDSRNELSHDTETHSKTPYHHWENLRRDEVHGCIETGGVEDNVKEDKEDAEAQTDAVGAVRFDEFGSHCGFAGEAEKDADASCDDEAAATKAVDEKAVEEVARDGGKVEKAEEEQRSASFYTEAGEELCVVVL